MANPASGGGAAPAQLGFLAIFNPTLSDKEENLDDQIVYYASVNSNSTTGKRRRTRGRPTEGISQEERNERLRQIGLAQGMISFSRGFSDGAPVNAIETEKTRVVIHELEPDWWILASIDLNRLPLPPRLPVKAGADQEEKFDFSTKEMKPTSLILSDLLRAHNTFMLHHDSSLTSLLRRLPRKKFIASLSRYWDLFLSTWNVMIHGNPTRAIFGGINIAASGELGVGVGEEERGSGEREVLEGLVGRIEGLVDLVVSKFGEEGDDNSNPKATKKDAEEPWLGSGREPGEEDGAVFLGTGALTRASVRNLTHWMEDIYSWGEHAYGVIESPTSIRRTRPKKPVLQEPEENKATSSSATEVAESVPIGNDEPPKASDGTKTNAGPDADKPDEDGRLDKMVSYLKLGYGSYWSIPGVAGSSGAATPQSDAPQSTSLPKAERPKLKRQASEAAGHYLIGLKGDMEETPEGEEQDQSDSEDDNSRTVLRTVHVELQQNDQDLSRAYLSPQAPASNPPSITNEKVRVVIYVNRPFIFVFLFRLRTDSLEWESLYRSLHYQLAPLRKPLLASMRFRPDRPDQGSGIRDVIWNPDQLTLHSTLPNIPDFNMVESVGPLAPPPRTWWSRADAVNTHLQILAIYGATRQQSTSDIERTCKTSRGWWIVWTRQAPAGPPVHADGRSSAHDSRPSSSHGEGSRADESIADDAAAAPGKEVILVRRAGDHARSGSLGSAVATSSGGAIETAGKLAQGIGVDTRRYIEDLLSIL